MRPGQTDLGKPAVTTALLTLLSAVAYVVSVLTWFLIIFGYTKYFASYHSLPACSFCLLVESVFVFGSFVGMGKFSISCLLTFEDAHSFFQLSSRERNIEAKNQASLCVLDFAL